MKLVNSILRSFSSIGMILILSVASSSTSAAEARSIAITLVDDATDATVPGALTESSAKQLRSLLDIAGIEAIFGSYFLVQETVAKPVVITLSGWQAPDLPVPPSDSLPYEKFVREMTRFMGAVKAAQKSRSEWQTVTASKLDNFLHNCVAAQRDLAERWIGEFQRRGMRDFRRSCVADTILAAASALPTDATINFIIFSTDFEDAPPGKPARKTPFTAIELRPSVHLIYLSTSGNFPRSPLLKELTNPGTAVTDLRGAVNYIKKIVSTHESTNSFVTNQHRRVNE